MITARLGPREKQVVNGVVRGLSNRAIAWELRLAEETPKEYLKAIFRKTGATNRTELAVMAITP